MEQCGSGAWASQLLSLLIRFSVILSKLAFAVCDMGAALISCFVLATVFFGTGVGPSFCVGQAGEKWSLTAAQHGQINQ